MEYIKLYENFNSLIIEGDDETIHQFDRAVLNKMKADIESALENVKLKYGLESVQIVGGTFGSTDYTAKIMFKAAGASDNPERIARLKQLARAFNLPEDIIGFEYTEAGGNTYRVINIDPRKRKNPVQLMCIAGRLEGRAFKASAQYIGTKYNATNRGA